MAAVLTLLVVGGAPFDFRDWPRSPRPDVAQDRDQRERGAVLGRSLGGPDSDGVPADVPALVDLESAARGRAAPPAGTEPSVRGGGLSPVSVVLRRPPARWDGRAPAGHGGQPAPPGEQPAGQPTPESPGGPGPAPQQPPAAPAPQPQPRPAPVTAPVRGGEPGPESPALAPSAPPAPEPAPGEGEMPGEGETPEPEDPGETPEPEDPGKENEHPASEPEDPPEDPEDPPEGPEDPPHAGPSGECEDRPDAAPGLRIAETRGTSGV